MKVIKIQKMWRYRKFKQALLKYHNAIQLIQAHWRGKLLRRTYQLVRKSAILIQKVVKKHLMKQYYIAQHWKKQK
jgi:myosin heavy subunit